MARDRQSTKPGADRRRVTVAEAAEILGITAEAVRTRIKRGKLDSVKEPPGPAGTVYVLLQADQTEPNLDATPQGQDRTSDQTPGGRQSESALIDLPPAPAATIARRRLRRKRHLPTFFRYF